MFKRIQKTFFFAVLPVLLSSCMSGKTTSNIPAVTNFELPRYLGTWYEIARLPHTFERGMDEVSAQYTMNQNGTVKVINAGTRAGTRHDVEGVGKFKGAPSIGELRVSFFRPFYGDYRIIELDPEYRYVIVTSSTMNYFWILSRTPTLPEETLQKLIAQAAEWGFETSKFEYPKQTGK